MTRSSKHYSTDRRTLRSSKTVSIILTRIQVARLAKTGLNLFCQIHGIRVTKFESFFEKMDSHKSLWEKISRYLLQICEINEIFHD